MSSSCGGRGWAGPPVARAAAGAVAYTSTSLDPPSAAGASRGGRRRDPIDRREGKRLWIAGKDEEIRAATVGIADQGFGEEVAVGIPQVAKIAAKAYEA